MQSFENREKSEPLHDDIHMYNPSESLQFDKEELPMHPASLSDQIRTPDQHKPQSVKLEKKPFMGELESHDQLGVEEKEDNSYFSNTQELAQHQESKSKRSSRHRTMPKILGDEFVTNMTGKRRADQPNDDDKSNVSTSRGRPGRRRDAKAEVSPSLISIAQARTEKQRMEVR